MNQSHGITHDATNIYSIRHQQLQNDLTAVIPKDKTTDWTTTLLLSFMAGLSTCIGAAIVFCLDHPSSLSSSSNSIGNRNTTTRRTTSKLGPSHMAFSLTLAGSVMITVSIASILPESFLLDDDIHYTPFGSIDFYQRCVAFTVGCGLYIVLSKFVFPAAPDELISFTLNDKDDDEDVEFIQNTNTRAIDGLGDRTKNGSTDALILLLDDDDSTSDDIHYRTNYNNDNTRPIISKTLQRKKNVGSTSFDSQDEPVNCLSRTTTTHTPAPVVTTKKGKLDANGCRWTFTYFTKYMRGSDIIDTEARRKWRVTMLLLISLAVHNFPEGLAVAASALHSPHLGITTTIAIALHNIPEGIAIAIPCLAARPDLPWLAFGLASLSGLAEPLGAIVALLVIDQGSGDTDINDTGSDSIQSMIWNAVINMKNVLSFVAGIMMTVAIVELFPEARRHMQESSTPGILGTLIGAIVMLASDAYLES